MFWPVYSVGLVTPLLNDSEAGGDPVLIKTTVFVDCVNQVILMLTSLDLKEKSREVCITARSHSFSRKGNLDPSPVSNVEHPSAIYPHTNVS